MSVAGHNKELGFAPKLETPLIFMKGGNCFVGHDGDTPRPDDAGDIAAPQALTLTTSVNGVIVQQGSTADMILDVAGLVSYLSENTTLMPGDMILTGMPHGVHFCAAGDTVVTKIEGIGRLVNHLVAA